MLVFLSLREEEQRGKRHELLSVLDFFFSWGQKQINTATVFRRSTPVAPLLSLIKKKTNKASVWLRKHQPGGNSPWVIC